MSLTQDEIIRMARDAGFVVQIHGECFGHTTLEHRFNPDRLEAFAALVAAYERELVDLTDDEIDLIEQQVYCRTTQKGRPLGVYAVELVRAVIAAFKEKNK